MPFDYVTDEVDFEARYAADNSFVALSWYLSDFQNDNTALFWEQPFIGAPGARLLAQGLRDNVMLETLILSANNVGDEGVSAIAEALYVRHAARPSGLRRLYLEGLIP